jgi:hypothetical protein
MQEAEYWNLDMRSLTLTIFITLLTVPQCISSDQEAGPLPNPALNPYDLLAEASGGEAFPFTAGDFADPERAKLIGDIMARVAQGSADIVRIYDQVDEAAQASWSFPVDAQQTSLCISSRNASLRVKDPEGNDIPKLALKVGDVCSVQSPALGKWTVEVEPHGGYSLTVKACGGTLEIAGSDFLEIDDRPGHRGYRSRKIPPNPKETCPVKVVMRDHRAYQSAQFSLRRVDGSVIEMIDLRADDQSPLFMGTITVPHEPFRVYVNGADATGALYQRASAQVFTGNGVSFENFPEDGK